VTPPAVGATAWEQHCYCHGEVAFHHA